MPPEITRLPVFSEEWGEEFVARMRDHMDQLYASVNDLDEDFVHAPDPVVLSGQPFCGCEDCDERERYTLATILIIEGYEAGKVRLE